MAYGIDSQINERVDTYSSDPQKLMQRYTQSQSLLDLLALQKLKSEKEAAMRNIQAQMQPPMNTVRDQREQQVLDMTRNEVAQQAMQGGQQLALNQQREMQARGLPTQAAPNMQRMADGGIVGYAAGDLVEAEENIDPETGEPIIPLGALFELLGRGRRALFSPSQAQQEARDIRRGEVELAAASGANMFDILPAPERLSSEQLAGLGAIDFTGSIPIEIQQQREADLASGATAQKLEAERAARIENNAAPPVDADRVRAEQYMGSDQQVDDMMADIYRGVEPEAPAPKGEGLAGLAQAMTPSRLQELRQRREQLMGGITSPERLQRDKLRAYLSGLGQTGLGGGAAAYTKEQQRQDALQIGDLDRLIELEREDEKLQREIDASMAEVVAKNEAELTKLLMETSLRSRLEQAGDRRKFIADVLKQVQEDSVLNPALKALEKAKDEGDITRDQYETQRLDIIMQMISGLPASYDVETGLGGTVEFTTGSFD